MPNWCENHLHISGSKESIAKIVRATKLDQQLFDFNGVVPMPPELEIISGSSTSNAMQLLYGDWEELLNSSWVKERAIHVTQGYLPSSREEFIHLVEHEHRFYERTECFGWMSLKDGRQAKANEEKYGYRDWYNWNIDNWGTKWNTYDVHVSDIGETRVDVYFETAWSPPVPVMVALCEQYPDVTLEMCYAELGCYFAGVVAGEGGHCEDFPATDADIKEFYREHFDPDYQEGEEE